MIKAVLVEEPSSGSGPVGTLGTTAGLTFEQQELLLWQLENEKGKQIAKERVKQEYETEKNEKGY